MERLVLKVCIAVLMVLIVLPVLEMDLADVGDLQMLALLDSAIHQMSNQEICSMIRRLVASSNNRLIFMALGTKVASIATNVTKIATKIYWAHDCECCEPPWGADEDLIDHAQARMDATGLQAHELARICLGDLTCTEEKPRSMAVFDLHAGVRQNVGWSLAYSSLGVTIMILAVIFFTIDVRKLYSWLLDPVWLLLDDLVALKSIEVVETIDVTGRTWMPRVTELADLRSAIQRLRSALRSWVKYVPMKLIGKLYNVGIEANLGVHYSNVTVFFCDLDGLEEVSKVIAPRAFLQLMSEVYIMVSEALENHRGTLLEFIGNEILAVFNAPDQVVHHCKQCLFAALEVQDRFSEVTKGSPSCNLSSATSSAEQEQSNEVRKCSSFEQEVMTSATLEEKISVMRSQSHSIFTLNSQPEPLIMEKRKTSEESIIPIPTIDLEERINTSTTQNAIRSSTLDSTLSVQETNANDNMTYLKSMHLRIGIHTAKVLVGNIGAPTRIKYGMLGDGVNIAARLKSLNSHYGTTCLVSEITLDRGGRENFIARPIGHLILKGRTEPTNTWELLRRPTDAPEKLVQAVELWDRGFRNFQGRHFQDARDQFEKSGSMIAREGLLARSHIDCPSQHFVWLCDQYLSTPPPAEWDGSEQIRGK